MQIEFNGQAYKLETLVSLAGFGRQEKVAVKDITIINGSACKSKLPVCHVYDGKIYLLAGEIVTSNDYTQVSILTKHVLKKALMSVQSQPIDTHFSSTRAPLTAPSQLSSKSLAALARLNVGSTGDRATYAPHQRRDHAPAGDAAVSERARAALRILEATIYRKS